MPPVLAHGRHSGVLVPLFSVPSSESWGIGEILDIPIFTRYLREAGQTFLQILPINEMAPGQKSPYSAITAMAIDPLFISLRGVEEFQAAGGEDALPADARQSLRDVRASAVVAYDRVHRLKQTAFRRAFAQFERASTDRVAAFDAWVREQAWWLYDYAVFRALHAHFEERPWTEWPDEMKACDAAGVARARRDLASEIRFYQYLQWVADRQWQQTRASAGVALVGDLAFMVDLDSADVWAHQDLFDLDASVGVPPDAFSETGQNWGLPVYRWETRTEGVDAWLRARARRSAALYDGYRIDHLVGFYRTYLIPNDGSTRRFRPAGEADQEAQGERVLALFGEQGSVVIAEDLGTVPDFVRASMTRVGVPGYRVLRWEREWHQPRQPFRDPAKYPALSVATSGTHDTEPAAVWWEQAPGEERLELAALAALEPVFKGRDPERMPFTADLRDALLEVLVASGSDLLILPIQDVFGWRDRINVPARVDDQNWTWRLPWPVEQLRTQPAARERAARLRGWCDTYHRA